MLKMYVWHISKLDLNYLYITRDNSFSISILIFFIWQYFNMLNCIDGSDDSKRSCKKYPKRRNPGVEISD